MRIFTLKYLLFYFIILQFHYCNASYHSDMINDEALYNRHNVSSILPVPKNDEYVIITFDDSNSQTWCSSLCQSSLSWLCTNIPSLFNNESIVANMIATHAHPSLTSQQALEIKDNDNLRVKHLKYAVKFWRLFDQGTEFATYACTSGGTIFYLIPNGNSCDDEWSPARFGAIFTVAASVFSVANTGVKYICSYRERQLNALLN